MSAPDQIPHRFYVISIEFLSLRRRRLFYKTSLAVKSAKRLLYSQATKLAAASIFPNVYAR